MGQNFIFKEGVSESFARRTAFEPGIVMTIVLTRNRQTLGWQVVWGFNVHRSSSPTECLTLHRVET